ncbi:Nitrogen permease regulator 3 [Penicillium oxalicum]|uniref:Nitrogen permease regulator 3 n=1 Tax=Penicillium oxalicum TaxID=69781 RepID=UPI0020B86625|nr:Nitrogen permease regulator 3 [Penicillium oxalicum]KAI2790212.1 Nitrogen permease regulator 3 [Penicillium oxalicum]
MSSIARPPDPCLVAIILIVRSRTGPRLVFNYPPNPLNENRLRTTTKGGRRVSRTRSRQGSRNTDSSSSSDTGLSSDEDEDEREPHHLAGSVNVGTNLASNLSVNLSAGLGRRASNFGIDPLALAPDGASPGVAESQRAGSIGSARPSSLRRRAGASSDHEDDAGSDWHEDESSGGSTRAPWESLLGLPGSVWEKLLSPSRSWHKKRFEVGINDLALIGWPVFVREDGTWRKQRRKKKKKKSAPEWDGGELGHNENSEDGQGEDDLTATPDMGGSVATITELSLTASPTDYKRTSTASSRLGKHAEDGIDTEDNDQMTMFNVVFVMDPPLLEYSTRIKDIYENVIKKFAKALKWEQARNDYVWRESQHILQVRRRARENRMVAAFPIWMGILANCFHVGTSVHNLYSELINQSTLARAIYTVYSSISASKIASVSFSPDVSISLQIPPLTSTPYLAGPTDRAYPGLWLTTADSATPIDDPHSEDKNSNNNQNNAHQVLAKHFALLLLDSEAAVIKDVEASGGALAPALAHYIRFSKPTKSFAQISASSGIPLSTIQMLASHLVYWRRARAIPPIHQRDTYIVSPNCDLSKLEIATIAYQATFPTLPSLPKMLSALSGTPRPYGSFIPSKDHKETYFSILAWLLRGGWVTQLRSFARVKVSPEIKLGVETALRKEEVDRYLAKSNGKSTSDDERSPSPSDADAHSSSSSSLASHGSGEETPMPGGRLDPHARLQLSHKLLDRSTAIRLSSLIPAPQRASPLESRWLDEILARFPTQPNTLRGMAVSGQELAPHEQHDVLRQHWPILVKYFNGFDALEKIPVRENLKRKLVAQALMRLGFLTGPVSYVEPDSREQVLVGVRHW